MSKTPDKPRRVLGKGLSALLPARTEAHHPAPPKPAARAAPLQVPVEIIDPNPLQPRTVFDPTRLQELADSIRVHGIIQPLIVRAKGERYELVAGERRLRAAKLAQSPAVPVVVQDFADNLLLELSLIENIQREDLNPIETAHAFDRLVRELLFSHEEIARRTGKDRSTVTNTLRLLRLPPQIQLLLAEGRLSMGHARALLSFATEEQQVEFGTRAAAHGYSVRDIEKLVSRLTDKAGRSSPDTSQKEDPNVKAAMATLGDVLGTRVRLVPRNAESGRIEIEYYSQDDLTRIYSLIVYEKQ